MHFQCRAEEPSEWKKTCLGLYGSDTPGTYVEGLEAGDIDTSGLDDLLEGIQDSRIFQYHDCVTEPTPISELICDRLGLLSIAPILAADGGIGFARYPDPCGALASAIEVDSDLWDGMKAAKVRTVLDGEPVLTWIHVAHSYDYKDGEWSRADVSVLCDDGRAILGGKTLDREYMARGLVVGGAGEGYFQSVDDLARVVAEMSLSIFGVFGRQSTIVDVPCTWISRQLLVGDLVLLTHECVVNPGAGAVGTSDQVAVVVVFHK